MFQRNPIVSAVTTIRMEKGIAVTECITVNAISTSDVYSHQVTENSKHCFAVWVVKN